MSFIARHSVTWCGRWIGSAKQVVVLQRAPDLPQPPELAGRIRMPVHSQVGDWPAHVADDQQTARTHRALLAPGRLARPKRLEQPVSEVIPTAPFEGADHRRGYPL